MDIENMTREEAVREIREKTPELLKEYRALAEMLAPLFDTQTAGEAEAKKQEITQEELQELYEGIAEFAEGYDLDSIDSLLMQAHEYSIPEDERERFGKIEARVRASDWDGLKELL